MTLLLRALTRTLGALLMVALALVGLGVAAYCFSSFISLGSSRPDRLLHLASVRRHVGHFLTQIAHSGPTAALALLCGVGAMLIGLLLLVGVLRPRRQRLAVLDHTRDVGSLSARPRVLQEMARASVQRAPGVTGLRRPRVSLSRRGTRGRITLVVSRARTSDPREVRSAVAERLEPISGPFSLRTSVRLRIGKPGERVQ